MTDLGPLLDSHCHLGAYDDPVAVMDAAAAANVSLVAVTESPEEFRRLRTRLGRRPTIEVALGLHPLRAASFRPADIAVSRANPAKAARELGWKATMGPADVARARCSPQARG